MPATFGGVVRRVQAYDQPPSVARLDPDADLIEQRGLYRQIEVTPYTELLQLNVISEADESGVIPFRIHVTDPSGAVARPTFVGVGNGFYRIPFPAHGKWTYQVAPDRRGRLTHHVVMDRGLKILPFCPSVVELGKAIPLHFSVITPGGQLRDDSFKMGGLTYHVARAEMTVVDPNGDAQVVRAALQDRMSPYAGEFTVADWQGDVVGSYDVEIVTYVRRARDVHSELLTLRSLVPTTIQVVEDREQLPLVALDSVTPSAPSDRPIPLLDAPGEPHRLEFSAEVLDPGVGVPSPAMLGRAIRATVRRGNAYELVDGGAAADSAARRGQTDTRLAGGVESVGSSPFVALTPDTRRPQRLGTASRVQRRRNVMSSTWPPPGTTVSS